MTEEQLRALLGEHEADYVEFTTSTNDTDKFSEAVCAFANDLPNRKPYSYSASTCGDGSPERTCSFFA